MRSKSAEVVSEDKDLNLRTKGNTCENDSPTSASPAILIDPSLLRDTVQLGHELDGKQKESYHGGAAETRAQKKLIDRE